MNAIIQVRRHEKSKPPPTSLSTTLEYLIQIRLYLLHNLRNLIPHPLHLLFIIHNLIYPIHPQKKNR